MTCLELMFAAFTAGVAVMVLVAAVFRWWR